MRKLGISSVFFIGVLCGIAVSFGWMVQSLRNVDGVMSFIYRRANLAIREADTCEGELALCEQRRGLHGLMGPPAAACGAATPREF